MTRNCEACGGKLIGLAHIGIKVRDIEASKAFYQGVLGFTLTDESCVGEQKLAFLNFGSCLIELVSGREGEGGSSALDHIAIEVKDIEPLVCRLTEKRLPFEEGGIAHAPQLLGGARCVFFRGPDGERLEFFEYLSR